MARSHGLQFLLQKVDGLRIGWNERQLSEEDFFRLCHRFKITVTEMPLRVSGFYYSVMGGHFIAIDSKLPSQQRLFVMFHEFAHFLMHAPDRGVTANFHGIGRKTRKEIEADIFALIALFPLKLLETRTPAEMIDEEFFAPELIAKRVNIYETYGI